MLLMLFHLCARDGVGERQFSQVLLHEMNAIRQVMLMIPEVKMIFLCSRDFQYLASVNAFMIAFVATC